MSVESLEVLTNDLSVTNENENDDQNTNYDGPSLYNLPVEVFLNICVYLSPIFISSVLTQVCTRFKDILTDELLWRCWVSKRLNNKKYPPVKVFKDDFEWEKECVYIDRLHYLWKNNGTDTMTHIVLNDKHYASVDGVLLMRNARICVSGGRDRALAVWDLDVIHQTETAGEGQANKETAMSYSHNTIAFKESAHGGWVWALAAPQNATNIFYSASWDGTVKLWDICPSDLTCIQSFECRTSALCMACIDENVTVVGLFSPEILMFDKRADSAPVQTHRIHKASVLDIRLNQFRGNTLYSASEDRTVATFDLKAGEISCRKKLHAADEKAYALCLAINDDICPYALYAGDTLGNVHLLDGRTLKRLSTNELCVPEMVGSRKVRDMAMAPGTLVATFESGDIRIMNPTCPPNFVTSVKATTSNITRVKYENDVLAVATCDSAVEVWIPIERLETYSL